MLKADRNLFAQMILIAKSRKELEMKDVLCHPLGPLPWSLATPDETPRKTNKAILAKELQKDAIYAELIPTPSAAVIDGMALVQKTKGDHKTFGQLAAGIINSALRDGHGSERMDIVFDVYKDHSIKKVERLRRKTNPGVQYKSIMSGQIVHQWRKFLN